TGSSSARCSGPCCGPWNGSRTPARQAALSPLGAGLRGAADRVAASLQARRSAIQLMKWQRDDRMVMTSYDSPAAARRRLRLAVRKAREATGLTQGQVAEQLSWSISKVNRMENGEVTISPTDLSALLNLFGVKDRNVVNEMSRDAKAAKQRGWWHEARYR